MNQPENMTLQATLQQSGKATGTAELRQKLEWPGRICILLAVVVAPWLYGSVYFSAQFMIAVCCLVGIAFLWFESGVSQRRSLVLPYLMLPLFFGIVFGMLQLASLGESFQWLMGKQKELYPLLTGDSAAATSISMSRSDTWDQLGLLTVAFASLCLGCRYFRTVSQIKLFLITITSLGVAISMFGLVQSLTTNEPNLIYWTVELVGGGTPFGPYVNRNNAAGFLLICLGASMGLITILLSREQRGPKPLGTKDLPFWTQFREHLLRFIAELDAPKIAALLAAMVIVLGIIGSLSRGGVLAMLAGSIATLLLYAVARKPDFTAFIFIPASIIVVLMAFWLGFADQFITRMDSVETVEVLSQTDIRLGHWIDTWPATSDFGFFGSGIGAYDEVHRIYNKGRFQVVFRYAENQFYQALVELGWAGFSLLVASWALAFYYGIFLLFKGNSHSSVAVGVATVFVTTGVGAASVFDFGLYLPANMLLMSLFCGFAAYHAQSLSSRLKKRTWISLETPNSIAQVILLITFAALAMFALDFYRKWQVQTVTRGEFPYRKFAFDCPTLEETDQLIERLQPKIESTRYGEGVDYMARLLIHRCRLQALDGMIGNGGEEKERLWNRTSLDMIQENAWSFRQDGQPFTAWEFLREPFITDNLPWARQYLLENRKIDPMEPHTHLMLAQVNAIVGKSSLASLDMERAIMLAPSQTNMKYLAGFYYLQTGNKKEAARHLRALLEIDPTQFTKVMRVIFGGSNRKFAAISEITVARDIVPDDPKLLYLLASKHLVAGSEAKSLALNRAERILADLSASDTEMVKLRAEVSFEKGNFADAIDQFESYLDARPQDYGVHLRVAQIHAMLEDLETSEVKLEYILRMCDDSIIKKRAFKMKQGIDEKQEALGSSSSDTR